MNLSIVSQIEKNSAQQARYKIDKGNDWFAYGVYEKRWWGWSLVYKTNYLNLAKDYLKERVILPIYYK